MKHLEERGGSPALCGPGLVFLTGFWPGFFFFFLQAVWLWAPQGFRPLTRRMRRSSTAWRSPSATSSTSSRTSTPPGSPSPPSWTWTLRSPWRRCQTVPSRRWRSFTRPPTPSPAHSTPLNHHQQPISQGVSYYLCFSLCDGAVGFQRRPEQISKRLKSSLSPDRILRELRRSQDWLKRSNGRTCLSNFANNAEGVL